MILKSYELGVIIENKYKYLNLYDYYYNALDSRKKLNQIGFKKEEIIIKTRLYDTKTKKRRYNKRKGE